MTETTEQAISYDEAWRLASAATWQFAACYKHDFTFIAHLEGKILTASVSGNGDAAERYLVTAGPMSWDQVCGNMEVSLRVAEAGRVLWEGRPL